MHRCFVDPNGWTESGIVLSPSSEHHLVHVLRVRTGETVELFDGTGRRAVARVGLEKGSRLALQILESSSAAKQLVSFVLFQAIPKGTRMDFIVEKATELGAARIFPLLTQRVVVQLSDAKKMEDRRERWQRIAVNAAEQSGVDRVPEITSLSTLEAAMPSAGRLDAFIVGALTPDARPLRDVMAELRPKRPMSVGLLVGPEGDLTPLEYKLAADAGALPVSFGPHIFRVETAALFGLSVLSYELSLAPKAL